MINFALLASLPDVVPSFMIYLFFVLHGLFVSMFMSAFWPCIKYVVPNALTTTAYGITFCIQDSMIFLGTVLTGTVIDATVKYSGGYFWSSVMFFGIAFFATVIGGIVLVLDYKRDSILYNGIELT